MTAKMPMSGSPEKRRDCIAQLPLRSTSGGSKFVGASYDLIQLLEQLNLLIDQQFRVTDDVY
jgi:hypothetical protein